MLTPDQIKRCIPGVTVESGIDQSLIVVEPHNLHDLAYQLKDHPALRFDMLLDLCGVDYLSYGVSDWVTQQATHGGFSRAVVTDSEPNSTWSGPRFAVVCHLLSTKHRHRVRLRIPLPSKDLTLKTLSNIWPSSMWYEREAYDLFGIVFVGHPDLRRILTDYGFMGYPFRKDFPMIGQVELRYDATETRCMYESVDVQPRVGVPKVIRDDNRYQEVEGG